MRSLCHALLGRNESRPDDELVNFDMERVIESQAEEQLEKDAVAEFDRYRRMDEWSGSFQNLYSRAALHCQVQMMQAKIQNFDLMHFVPYTRPGTYDLLRVQAFECLVDLDISQQPELLRWLIYTMTSDCSAYVRYHCQRLFGRALAQIAFGRPQQTENTQVGGLIIEQESSTEIRQADLARRQTVPGAIEALKREVFSDTSLKEYMWSACNAQSIGVVEIAEICDICHVMYDPIRSKITKLKYPHYWKVQNLGNGKLRFFKSNKVRTSVGASKHASTKRKREEMGPPGSGPRITFKQTKTGIAPGTPSAGLPKLHIPNPAATPTASSTPAASAPSTPASAGGLKLKLKFGSKPK